MHSLRNPEKDRQVPKVPVPPHRRLTEEFMYPRKKKGRPDWRCIKEHLHQGGLVEKSLVGRLVCETERHLRHEANLIEVEDPVTIVGDIHG